MDWFSESLWHGPPILGERELKQDEHSKQCGNLFGKNNEVLEGGANLQFWNTWGNIYQDRNFSRGCAITIVVCNCPHTFDTANSGYEFRTKETVNHLLFMDDLKLHSKKEKTLDSPIQTVRIFRKDIGM